MLSRGIHNFLFPSIYSLNFLERNKLKGKGLKKKLGKTSDNFKVNAKCLLQSFYFLNRNFLALLDFKDFILI